MKFAWHLSYFARKLLLLTNKQANTQTSCWGNGSGSGWNAAIVVFSVFTARQAVSAIPSLLQVPVPIPTQSQFYPWPSPRPFSLFTLSANEFYILGFVCLRVARLTQVDNSLAHLNSNSNIVDEICCLICNLDAFLNKRRGASTEIMCLLRRKLMMMMTKDERLPRNYSL